MTGQAKRDYYSICIAIRYSTVHGVMKCVFMCVTYSRPNRWLVFIDFLNEKKDYEGQQSHLTTGWRSGQPKQI